MFQLVSCSKSQSPQGSEKFLIVKAFMNMETWRTGMLKHFPKIKTP